MTFWNFKRVFLETRFFENGVQDISESNQSITVKLGAYL